MVLICKDLSSLHPRVFCANSAKYAWNWFWRRRFLNIINVFSLFCYYLLLEKSVALHLKKIESLSPKNALCQVLLKYPQRLWRRGWKCKSLQRDRQTDRSKTTCPPFSSKRGYNKLKCLPSIQFSWRLSEHPWVSFLYALPEKLHYQTVGWLVLKKHQL